MSGRPYPNTVNIGRVPPQIFGIDRQKLYANYGHVTDYPLLGSSLLGSSYIDYETTWGPWWKPDDVVSRLARLVPPKPPMPYPAESVEQMLQMLARDPCAFDLLVIDSVSGAYKFERAPVLDLRGRIAYYFRGNLDEWVQ